MSVRPLITLLTDFGTRDGYVGAIKGCIHTRVPDARLVDISHDIAPQDVYAAAWCLHRAFPHFPADTIHVVVIDPGVGSERAPLLIRQNQQWLIGPDNGVLSLAGEGPPEALYRLHRETRWWRAHQSFDGLALFSPAACCLALGHDPADLGTQETHRVQLEVPGAERHGDALLGSILLFDRFGNAVTNLSGEDLRTLGGEVVAATCGDTAFRQVDHYAVGRPGEPIAILNSDGLLELSCFQGCAQTDFGLQAGDAVRVSVATD